jgi:hypothetical protein
MKKHLLIFIIFGVVFLISKKSQAQQAITAATITTSSDVYSSYSILGTGSAAYSSATTYTLEYGNSMTNSSTTRNLVSFQIGATNYSRVFGPNVVNLIREAATTCPGMNTCCLPANGCTNRFISYYEQTSSSGDTRILNPPYNIDPTVFFGGTVLNRGADNVFVNRNDGNGNNNDVERIDYIFRDGLTTTDVTKAGFVLFDRGTGDNCRIKAISSLSGDTPTGYFDADAVTAGSQALAIAGGSFTTEVGVSANYVIVRKDGAATDSSPSANITGQRVIGTFISFADLGIANNDVVYGYSLVANDVALGTNLLSTSSFSKTTNNATGGLDLTGVSGAWVEVGANLTLLPLHLTSFKSIQKDCKTELIWNTVQESHIKHFEIQQSTNGNDFYTIGKLDAKNRLEQTTYKFSIKELVKQAYYRLKIVEEYEEPHYSNIISVHNECANPAPMISLFPNPTESNLTCIFHTEMVGESCNIEIYNQLGLLVGKKSEIEIHQNKTTIDVNHLPAGTYIVHFIHFGNVSIAKFIKN